MVVKVGCLKLIDRFGGGEGVDGVFGLGLQSLMLYLVFLVGQFRGVAWRVASVSAWSMPALKSVTDNFSIWSCKSGDICDHRCAIDCMWMGGGMVEGMGGLKRCPWEHSGPEPEIARRARVRTGEVGVASRLAGVTEEPCPARAEAVRRVAAEEVLVIDPDSDIVVRLGGARGCTTDESNSQGRGECRARERVWQSVSCCGTVSCLGTRSNIRTVAGNFLPSVD